MTRNIFPTLEQMEAVNDAIEAAQAREIKDDHLTDTQRLELVTSFESVFGTVFSGGGVTYDD